MGIGIRRVDVDREIMMKGVSQALAAKPSSRIEAVDFWRGAVLITIFVNHIPGNVLEFITQKNYGFSDSAEAFVFLAGVSMTLAYRRRLSQGQAGTVFGAVARRAVKLYGVHVALCLVGVGIFALGALAIDDPALMEVHGRDLFADDPIAALIGLISLGHQPGYFNILPLYVLLLAPGALLLWIGSRRIWPMLTLSLLVYVTARVGSINVPTWPMRGSWFFDPFAWQLMLALGIGAAIVVRERGLPRSRLLTGLAIAVVLAGATIITNGFGLLPGLETWTRPWADVDKTVLGLGRVVHFAALAYLVAVADVAGRVRSSALYEPLCRLGRNSLSTFAVLSLLAAIGQVIGEAFGHSVLLDLPLLGSGFAVLYGVATLIESRQATPLRAATRDAQVIGAKAG